ncbi:hypothetical protein FHR83_004799 [Actinoplanes campanulatus]|uniref:Uncharacterized protein n=1 Tax=Actinoplanes campanulatus TaxID=113559 RepID=A0A7W5AJZ8_9ACTN|nr:hypothetical protein [Actinoplanes campanulatus]MBB3097124.1 hypothetical protein [Actinoplanes campanulatus]GGN15846.1 hypothetical protein GCM10010109_27830 [Actinoplanes campanulatus]GID37694.1 hypothetical protein Aca09nite_42000 [Actinoplanes campanulatus]
MARWSVVLPDEQWATERLFQHDVVTVAGGPAEAAVGDEVLVVAEQQVVALARVEKTDGGLALWYLRRAFDEPVPAALSEGPIDEATFRRFAERLGGPSDRKPWLVSVAMPIEAVNPAEAVRQFWSHVLELGPAELPTYVWPSGDELAMQAFVLGAEANQDPEEEDDED